MKSFLAHPGHRARKIVPALRGRTIAVALPQDGLSDDLKTFWMTFAGGLVFFGTFFG